MVGEDCGDDSTCSACVLWDYTALSNGMYTCDDTGYYSDCMYVGALPGCYWDDGGCGSSYSYSYSHSYGTD